VQHAAIDAWHAGAPSLLDAALTADFGSYTRFYTVFRRLTGRSPRTLQPERDADGRGGRSPGAWPPMASR